MKNIERNVCRYEYVTIFLWRKLTAQNFISNSFTCACVWCFIYVATSTTIKYVFTDINSSIHILLSSLYCIRVLIHKITFGMRNKAKVCIMSVVKYAYMLYSFCWTSIQIHVSSKEKISDDCPSLFSFELERYN